jgi:hypothetical protein
MCTMLALLAVFAGSAMKFWDLVQGEWAVLMSRNYLRQPNIPSKLTVEFHPKDGSALLEGTVWRDDIPSSDVLPIESFFLAHLELEFETDFTGRIFTLQPAREFMSSFGLQPLVAGVSFSARLKLPGNWTLDLRLTEGGQFSAVASTRSSSATVEYSARKRAQVAVAGSSRRMWWIFGAVFIGVQVFLFIILRNYRASLNKKIDNLRETVTIDLDKIKPEKKRKTKGD